MAVPELTPSQNAHLRSLMREALPRYNNSVNRLAMELRMAPPSLLKFLKEQGGASKATAAKFAELEGLDLDDILERHRHTPTAVKKPVDRPPGQAFAPTAAALKTASLWILEGPYGVKSARAIELAAPLTFLTNERDAGDPRAVREALLHTMFGTAAHMPSHPSPPSGASPPAGTRRSRMRGR